MRGKREREIGVVLSTVYCHGVSDGVGRSLTVRWRQSPRARQWENMNPESDTVCREIWDSRTSISQQGDPTTTHHTMSHLSSLDIVEYARKIGIVVEEEKELLPLAKEALNTRLPECWKPW